jgi:hypothetical protein
MSYDNLNSVSKFQFQISKEKSFERGQIDTTNTQMHDWSLYKNIHLNYHTK